MENSRLARLKISKIRHSNTSLTVHAVCKLILCHIFHTHIRFKQKLTSSFNNMDELKNSLSVLTCLLHFSTKIVTPIINSQHCLQSNGGIKNHWLIGFCQSKLCKVFFYWKPFTAHKKHTIKFFKSPTIPLANLIKNGK